MHTSNIRLKAEILSEGISFSARALENLPSDVLVKRRAYGNPDEINGTELSLPQELVLLPEGITVGISASLLAPFTVDYTGERFVLLRNDEFKCEIGFTRSPEFYGAICDSGEKVENVLTYVSGHYLGIFVNTACYFASPGRQCKYCSIRANSRRPEANLKKVTKESATSAVRRAVELSRDKFDLVFISGGNFTNRDENFVYYRDIALSIRSELNTIAPEIEVVLNVFPPDKLALIDTLCGSGINVLVSTEVFSEEGYAYHCPGKSKILPKKRLYTVLKRYVKALGKGHVYSIVIQGLESTDSLIDGIWDYAERGVCTVVNVLHLDPDTELAKEGAKRPDADDILRVAKELEKVYSKHGFDTRRIYGGRNSFDAECSLGLISKKGDN